MGPTIEMTTRNGEAISLVAFEEMKVTSKMAEKVVSNLSSVKDIEYKEGDILLCSYPKSGTHWLMHLMKELRKTSSYDPEVPPGLIEITPPEQLATAQSPRQMSTHLTPKRIQNALQNDKCKVVFVVRNPKDVAVSFFHHLKNSAVIGNKQSWDEYFESFYQGHVPGTPYFDYLDAWEAVFKEIKSNGKPNNVEIFYFEDMKRNPFQNICRLSRHLGIDKTDEELQEVIQACSIGNLREKVNNNKALVHKLLMDKDGKSVIFRKGGVGDWKNHFTVAQNEAFDKLIETRLKDSMFQFKYVL